jgi:hypothetical protein
VANIPFLYPLPYKSLLYVWISAPHHQSPSRSRKHQYQLLSVLASYLSSYFLTSVFEYEKIGS